MPKCIEGLEKKILECAENEFIEKSYVEVNMRKIAKKTNIAVGTLYNYYSNKKDLFFKVLRYSWDKTFIILQPIVLSNREPEFKLKLYLENLYNEVIRRKGLAHEILEIKEIFLKDNFKKEIAKTKFLNLIEKRIFKNIYEILSEIEEKNKIVINESEKSRLVASLIFCVFGFSKKYSTEKQKNIDFITKLAISLYNNN